MIRKLALLSWVLLAVSACVDSSGSPSLTESQKIVTSEEKWIIGPEEDFDPASLRRNYSIANPSSEPLQWEAQVSEPWLSLTSPAKGQLLPGQRTDVSVEVDPFRAGQVGVDSSTGQVFVTTKVSGRAVITNHIVKVESSLNASGGGGWTKFQPSPDSQIVYVSSSSGNDNNNGLSSSSPKRTIAAAQALLRHGYPDWLLLKRGDVWYESLGHWKKSGRSLSEPMVVSTYGSEKARPLLRTGSGGGIWTSPGGGSPPTIDNLAILGLHFVADTYSGIGECTGARMLQPGSYFLIEDCMFERYGTNVVFQAYSSSGPVRHYAFALRRSIIVDAHTVHGAGPHPQGLYAYAVDGLLVEECLFDHNGWSETVPNAGADIFSHNIYIDNDNTGVIVRRNIIANGASHGMQLRPGGSVVNNLFVRNSIALLVGGGNDPEPAGVNANVRGNVILDGKNIDAANPRGWGMSFANIAWGFVAFNVIANNTLGTQPSPFSLEADAAVNGGAGIGVHNLRIHTNLFYNWGGSMDVHGSSSQLTNIDLLYNHMQNLSTPDALFAHYKGDSTAGFESSGNRFFSQLASPFAWTWIGSAPHTIEYWMAQVGDINSVKELVSYAEPDCSVASYHALLGGVPTLEAFLAEARKQSSTNWRPELMAVWVNRYVRNAFVPQN